MGGGSGNSVPAILNPSWDEGAFVRFSIRQKIVSPTRITWAIFITLILKYVISFLLWHRATILVSSVSPWLMERRLQCDESCLPSLHACNSCLWHRYIVHQLKPSQWPCWRVISCVRTEFVSSVSHTVTASIVSMVWSGPHIPPGTKTTGTRGASEANRHQGKSDWATAAESLSSINGAVVCCFLLFSREVLNAGWNWGVAGEYGVIYWLDAWGQSYRVILMVNICTTCCFTIRKRRLCSVFHFSYWDVMTCELVGLGSKWHEDVWTVRMKGYAVTQYWYTWRSSPSIYCKDRKTKKKVRTFDVPIDIRTLHSPTRNTGQKLHHLNEFGRYLWVSSVHREYSSKQH